MNRESQITDAWSQVAIMFTLYELAGVFTNILAGIAGAKSGDF